MKDMKISQNPVHLSELFSTLHQKMDLTTLTSQNYEIQQRKSNKIYMHQDIWWNAQYFSNHQHDMISRELSRDGVRKLRPNGNYAQGNYYNVISYAHILLVP